MKKGQRHTLETLAKISASKIGKQFTAEHKEAIRQSLKGLAKSPEHKKNIAEGIRAAHLRRIQGANSTEPTQSIENTTTQNDKKPINSSIESLHKFWKIPEIARIVASKLVDHFLSPWGSYL